MALVIDGQLGSAWPQARLNTMTALSLSSLHLSARCRSARLPRSGRQDWLNTGRLHLLRSRALPASVPTVRRPSGGADASPPAAASLTTQLRSYEKVAQSMSHTWSLRVSSNQASARLRFLEAPPLVSTPKRNR
ncbi:hypothetical protein K505DRAFT_356606 [Melanomma pulvis-pyrius CBS 109.77]|uniref:Uncharacterized protein n=1 Tax=Melanomma pulvis-pyrius CBS 109.77 TaxID=1314802 RepID=A0A6A6XSR9_9PLEO|nr:hypothetical protein K505DRAFT_356606 [Melanomma pulvis-pyrius CBS 109.77]